MNERLRKPEEIIEEFFKSVQRYIQNLTITKNNLMDGLYAFANKAWEVPKKYKGNSSQMGFIAEYLVFETVKQYIAKKNNFFFSPIVRTKTSDGRVETNYFVDDLDKPKHFLCQGLQISDAGLVELGLQKINKAYDVTYLIKKDVWLVKSIFEIKSYFDYPGLKGDIDRLTFAEKSYHLDENFALVFVGFRNKDTLSNKEKELINTFTKVKSHFCVLPGEKDQELRNYLLEEVLNFIS